MIRAALSTTYDLGEAQRLGSTGAVNFSNPRGTTEVVCARFDFTRAQAQQWVLARLASLVEDDFCHVASKGSEHLDDADVYGVRYEGSAWYIKFVIRGGRLLVFSCHPPVAPMRTFRGRTV